MMKSAALVVFAGTLACDARPAPRTADSAAAPPSMKAMAPDTMMQRVQSTATARRADSLAAVRAADSTRARGSLPAVRKKAAAKTTSTPLRDSAFGPKYEVDSTGKVRQIVPRKKPPLR